MKNLGVLLLLLACVLSTTIKVNIHLSNRVSISTNGKGEQFEKGKDDGKHAAKTERPETLK